MLRAKYLAAAAATFGLFAGSAASQESRAVYVTPQGDKKVYTVTGTVPPDKLPAVAPAQPAPAAPVQPAPLPDSPPAFVPSEPGIGTPIAAPMVHPWKAGCDSGCASGHCGKHGPTSYWSCLRTPATVPPPLGAAKRGVFDMQRDNALAEYFVVYREDWLDARSTLNGTGERHVDGIIRRLALIGAPIRMEPTGIAGLDEKRMAVLMDRLIAAGVNPDDAKARIRFGTTRAEGLRYHDIDFLYQRTGGTTGGGGYGGFGGYGGGGFGGYGAFSSFGGIGGYR